MDRMKSHTRSSTFRSYGAAILAASFGVMAASLAQAGPITNVNYFPTPDEQYVLARINEARRSSNGLQILSHIVTNNFNTITASTGPRAQNGTPWSANFWTSTDPAVASALNSFQVDPGDLKAQFQTVTIPNTPFAWNPKLGNVASQYNDLVIADAGATSDPHSIPPYNPYPGNPSRYSDGGYTGANAFGENAFRQFAGSAFASYAGFMIDYTFTNISPDGIQNPTGHRDTLLGSFYKDIGISVKPGYGGFNASIEEFGTRSGISSLTGIAYSDTNANNFFDPGEGIGNATISATPTVGGGGPFQTTTWSAGGYTLELANGTYNVTATGVFGTIPLGTATINNQNFQLDVVTPVPEPASMTLVTLASLGLLARRHRAER